MRQVYVLEGDIYPYVRTTQRQKWADKRWGKYIASQNAIRTEVAATMGRQGWEMFAKEPLILGVMMQVSTGLHKRDASNQLKAIEDALQGLVYKNDAWLDEVSLARYKGEEDRAVVMVADLGAWSVSWYVDLWNYSAQAGVLVVD